MLLDGREVVQSEVEKLKQIVKEGTKAVVIQVGDNSASTVYVNNKIKLGAELGIECVKYQLPKTISEEELLVIIDTLNTSDNVHGILVQLPLPNHINPDKIAESIVWYKDVDCFNPINVGRVMLGTGEINPCTPQGIFTILKHYGLDDVKGKRVIIVGRSNIVGKPLANMFINRGATVVSCNSNTPFSDIVGLAYGCDILISAVGKANFFNRESMRVEEYGNYICPIGIDVGMNRDSDGKLCGDISRDVYDCFKFITPVPNGVGRTTVLELMRNIIKCKEIIDNEKF